MVEPTIPIYFYGGGRDAEWFKREIYNSVKTDVSFVQPEMQLETIPRVPDHLLHRFQVALGLSNNREEEMPLIALPEKYETWWEEPPTTATKRHIDFEELQKNLYGG
jgi:hypothetical protein